MESSIHEAASLWSPTVTRQPRYGVQQSRDSLVMESSSHEAASLWSPASTRQPRYGAQHSRGSLVMESSIHEAASYGVQQSRDNLVIESSSHEAVLHSGGAIHIISTPIKRSSVALMLEHCLRRWPNSKPALDRNFLHCME